MCLNTKRKTTLILEGHFPEKKNPELQFVDHMF